MAATRTLAEMRGEAQDLADFEASNGYISESTWNRWINLGCKKVYDKLVRARGFQYFGQKTTVDTVAGVETVTLPSDFVKVWGVSAAIQGQNVSLRPLEMADRDRYDFSTGWRVSAVPRYMPMAGTLLLRPIPDGVYTITLWYTPHFADLEDDADTFDGINGWEDYAVTFAAIRARIKEDSDVVDLRGELAEMDARIAAFSGDRDEGAPARVQDVRPRVDPEWPWG